MNSVVEFEVGTKNQFNSLTIKDTDTLYFITDTGELYKGTTLISQKNPTDYLTQNTADGRYQGKNNAIVKVSASGTQKFLSSYDNTLNNFRIDDFVRYTPPSSSSTGQGYISSSNGLNDFRIDGGTPTPGSYIYEGATINSGAWSLINDYCFVSFKVTVPPNWLEVYYPLPVIPTVESEIYTMASSGAYKITAQTLNGSGALYLRRPEHDSGSIDHKTGQESNLPINIFYKFRTPIQSS